MRNERKDSRESIVQTQLEAYNARDLETFASCYHPNIKVRRLEENEILIDGIEDFKSYYEKLFRDHPLQHCHLKSRIIIKDSVVDEDLITGRDNFPDGLHAVAIYGFREGIIDRIWFI